MPVPISVTGFATTAGSQEVHAEVAETGPSASDWFSKMRNDKSGESDDVDKKENRIKKAKGELSDAEVESGVPVLACCTVAGTNVWRS